MMPAGGMGMRSGASMAGVQTPSLNSWVALGELFSLSVPWFSTSTVAESNKHINACKTVWMIP